MSSIILPFAYLLLPSALILDADNLAKFVLDALNKGLYKDDSCIARLQVTKLYGQPARTEVTISEIDKHYE